VLIEPMTKQCDCIVENNPHSTIKVRLVLKARTAPNSATSSSRPARSSSSWSNGVFESLSSNFSAR